MSFLAPLCLAGAALVALPLLFHLIRRSSREKVKFSSLMFLRPSPPRLTKKSRLEHLLLLLLRCAVICLLAFAFSRPFVARPVATAPQAAQKHRVLVLVDASASMRRGDLWARAREAALKSIEKLEPGDEAALYVFDKHSRPILNFADSAELTPTERAAQAAARLSAIAPGWAGTHLGNALLGGAEYLLEAINRDPSDQGSASSRIVLISDLQSGAKLDGLQGFEWPANMEVEIVPLRPENLSNAGVQILPEQQRLFFASTNAPVRVRVQNSSGSKTEQFKLRWGTSESMDIYIPAGEFRIFEAPPRPAGTYALNLIGDPVLFDNTAFHAASEKQDAVVAFAGSDPGNDPNQSLYFLRRAFEQTNLAIRVVSFLSNAPPESIELLILGPSLPQSALAVARDVLTQGKTVILPLHDTNSAAMLAALNPGQPLPISEPLVRDFAILGEIDFNHPLFAPFADARYSDFTKVHFWKYRKVDLSAATNATVLARFDSGDPAFFEFPVGQGKLLVFASTWTPGDSQLALSSKFVPLMFATLERSADLHDSSRQFVVGDSIPAPEGSAEVILPNGEKEPVADGRFSNTSVPGIYSAGNLKFAVNIEPSESRIDPLTPDELRSFGVPLGRQAELPTAASVERERHLLATDLENRQKLWRNFILAALAFVLLETWLSGRLSRARATA